MRWRIGRRTLGSVGTTWGSGLDPSTGTWSSDEPEQHALSRGVIVLCGLAILLWMLLGSDADVLNRYNIRLLSYVALLALFGGLFGWSWSQRRNRDFAAVSVTFMICLFVPGLLTMVMG